MFFRGRTLRNLDPKARLMLSPEFREGIAKRDPDGKVVLTTYDGCVVAFPLPEWEQFEIKLTNIINPSRTVRNFRRLVLGGAEITPLDSQGRIRLTKEHLSYAGIIKETMIVGQGPRFELWAPDRLAPLLAQNFDDVAEAIGDTGFDFGL